MKASINQYSNAKRARFARLLLGLAALAATAATFALAIVAPATLPHADVRIHAHAVRQPTSIEVAILPGTIEVVVTRTKAAQAASPFVPASYRTRG